MVKGFICAVVFCSVSLIGIFINKGQKRRLSFFEDHLNYINFALECIKNSRMSCEEINKRFQFQCGADYKECLFDGKFPKYIKENERAEINDFFSKFGSLDLDCTIDMLNSQKIKGEDKVNLCSETVKNKGSMILKLCILGGLALVILLI